MKHAAQLAEVKHSIHEINAAAEVICTQRSQVDLARILDRHSYREGSAAADDAHNSSHDNAAARHSGTDTPAAPADTVAATPVHGIMPHAQHLVANERLQHNEALHMQHPHTHDTGIRTIALRETRRLDLKR